MFGGHCWQGMNFHCEFGQCGSGHCGKMGGVGGRCFSASISSCIFATFLSNAANASISGLVFAVFSFVIFMLPSYHIFPSDSIPSIHCLRAASHDCQSDTCAGVGDAGKVGSGGSGAGGGGGTYRMTGWRA